MALVQFSIMACMSGGACSAALGEEQAARPAQAREMRRRRAAVFMRLVLFNRGGERAL
jgi:hypothetical protein